MLVVFHHIILAPPGHGPSRVPHTNSGTASSTTAVRLLRPVEEILHWPKSPRSNNEDPSDSVVPQPCVQGVVGGRDELDPVKFEVEPRRFRPGMDYTLAVSEEKEARLDVCLGLTPKPPNYKNGHGRGRGKERDNVHYYRISGGSWESGEWVVGW